MENTITYVNFWREMEHVVGVVPRRIQRILEIENYAASSSIGDLKATDLADIETDFQLLAAHHAATLSADSFDEIYGPFKNCPDKFRLLSGERKTIMSIANTVATYGIEQFLFNVSKRTNFVSSPQSVEALSKIQAYYAERHNDSPEYKRFTEGLSSLSVLEMVPDGAIINCIFCIPNKPQKIQRCGSMWLLGNFVRHCRKLHYALPESGPKRKRQRLQKQQDFNGTNVAIHQGDKPNAESDLMIFSVELE